MTTFVYVGRHAEHTSDGRPLGTGDEVELSRTAATREQHNRMLIQDGLLIEKPEQATDEPAEPGDATDTDSPEEG